MPKPQFKSSANAKKEKTAAGFARGTNGGWIVGLRAAKNHHQITRLSDLLSVSIFKYHARQTDSQSVNELIEKLVPPKQQAAAQLLLEDCSSRTLIRQQLSQLAEDDAGVLPQKSFSWILCKLTTFGAEDRDTLRIYQAFLSQLGQLGHMCRLLSHEGAHCTWDTPAAVANRITIGLGLFYEQAVRRHQQFAAPSPKYYQQLAAGCFATTGYKAIALKLPQWIKFLQDNFVLPRL